MTDNSSRIGSIQRNLNNATNSLSRANEKLASGKRINKASDDAAGLAIAQALLAEEATLKVASQNISYGGSATAIQDAALVQIGDIASRQAELATQAANGTLSDAQRVALNEEYQALGHEAQRISATTQFNGVKVLEEDVTLQVGTDSSANSQITLSSADTAALTGAIGNILTAGAAVSAIDNTSSRVAAASATRGELGSTTSRLDYAQANVEARAVSVAEARARIEDVDVAEQVANQIASRVNQDAATAVLAQAKNIVGQTVLRLLG